ncbi:hypothetical protein J1N35_018968, partial [Gossypium stocksii]
LYVSNCNVLQALLEILANPDSLPNRIFEARYFLTCNFMDFVEGILAPYDAERILRIPFVSLNPSIVSFGTTLAQVCM